MTLNDLERLFHDKMRFRPALLESERLNVRNSTTSGLCDSAVFSALHDQLASLGRHAQLTRCFSAVAELLVYCSFWKPFVGPPPRRHRYVGLIYGVTPRQSHARL